MRDLHSFLSMGLDKPLKKYLHLRADRRFSQHYCIVVIRSVHHRTAPGTQCILHVVYNQYLQHTSNNMVEGRVRCAYTYNMSRRDSPRHQESRRHKIVTSPQTPATSYLCELQTFCISFFINQYLPFRPSFRSPFISP